MTYDSKWEFWIDRGGTFTDVVARCPDGSLVTVCSMVSEFCQVTVSSTWIVKTLGVKQAVVGSSLTLHLAMCLSMAPVALDQVEKVSRP